MRQISQPVELSGYEVLRRIDRGDDRRSVLADDASGTRVECLIGSECGQPISDSAPPKWTHPHLVAISDVVAANDAHGPIVVFGHRQGGTLSALVRDNGPLSLGETSTIMRPLIDVTAFLHSRGIGHGRISPENVFISAYGKPALLPPSSARLLDPGSETRRHGLESGRREGHADLADLGTLAWTLLAGHPPGADRPPIRVLRPDVPDGWVSLIEEPEKISVADAAAIFASPSSGIMPEPLRLSRTDRAEPSSDALTMQLRIAALDEKEPGEPVHRRRHATRLRQRHPRTVLIGSVAAAVAAGVMCAVLAVTVFPRPMRALLLGHDDDSASVARASGPATTRTPGKQRARASPAADPLDAVRALIRIRTSMFQAADPGLLERLDAPGSSAMDADAEKIRRLNLSGVRLAGLRLDVRSARLMNRDGDTATIAVTLKRSAYRQVDRDGTEKAHRPGRTERHRLTLAKTGGRWLIAAVD